MPGSGPSPQCCSLRAAPRTCLISPPPPSARPGQLRKRAAAVPRAMPPSLEPTGELGSSSGKTDGIVGWAWSGRDEFSQLGDRKDEPALPLPYIPLKERRRMVLVRHGQSTWNARNRIQGCSNFAVLTELGRSQAAVAKQVLSGWDFHCMFLSPLKRAAQTSEIVWGKRKAPTVTLPSLREIDLYSFQGLDKLAIRAQYSEEYRLWQYSPAAFEIDGHAPVRELWHRASLAWRQMLHHKKLRGNCGLVVAHNAVNQALLCTALGLPPAFFRRFSQSNAAFSVIDFESGGGNGQAPVVRVERMNQFPDRPLDPSKLGKSLPNRLVLVSGEATNPAVQASLNLLAESGTAAPALIGIGSTAQQVLDITTAMQAALTTPGDGRTVVAVASGEACQALLSICLGVAEAPAPSPADEAETAAPGASHGEQQQQDQEQAEQQQQQQGTEGDHQALEVAADGPCVGSLFHMSDGGITIINWPFGQRKLQKGTVLCTNYQLDHAVLAPEGSG